MQLGRPAEVDGDGWFDFFTGHLEGETNTLYLNNGDGTFSDRTVPAGLAGPSLPLVAFGTNFFDFDHDGDLDLFVANGHILDNVALYRGEIEYAQGDFLFRNEGGARFADVSLASGPHFRRKTVGRGSAVADLDGDGDLDLAVSNNDSPAAVLFNRLPGGGRSILVRLVATESNRSAIGAVVRIEAGGVSQAREIRAGSSYLSQSDLRAHFGLGNAERVDRLEVRWPAGGLEAFEGLPADTLFTIEEGGGITERTALRP